MQAQFTPTSSTPTDSRAVRVLIVDDETAVTAILTTMLTRRGFVVASAPTAEQGRTRAREGEYDVALVDVGLRDGCGLALADELEAEYGLAGRVILMTGGLAPREARCALKPFNYPALLQLINEVAAQGEAAARGADAESEAAA